MTNLIRMPPRSMLFNSELFWLQGVKDLINSLNIKREEWGWDFLQGNRNFLDAKNWNRGMSRLQGKKKKSRNLTTESTLFTSLGPHRLFHVSSFLLKYFVSLLEKIHDQQQQVYWTLSLRASHLMIIVPLISKLIFSTLGRNFHIPSIILRTGDKLAQWEGLCSQRTQCLLGKSCTINYSY